MPGFAGFIRKATSKKNEADINRMIECMMHEPSYTRGTYTNERVGIYTGWTCHKNSFDDCLPILNEQKDITLIFSGEDFYDEKINDELKAKGHSFEMNNASYLIHLYEEFGEDFISRINGWFSGVLIDNRKGMAVLFNDRFGMKRIYYHEGKDAFYFSTEAKTLLRICPELREIDPTAAGEFLACGCTLNNRSLFAGIQILPGGSAWTIDLGKDINKKRYFDFSQWEHQEILDKKIFYDRFHDIFHEILPRYIQSKDHVALSLTGGFDTRMIMACFKAEPDSLPCYTFGGMHRDCYDVKIARKIALTCQRTYSVLKLDASFLQNFPKHAERTIYITDGCVDVGVSHEIYLNSLARDIAPVRMTGNYGSEVLRSVNYIRASSPIDGLINPNFKPHIQNAVSSFSSTREGRQLTYAVTKLIPWHLYGRLSAAQSQLTVRTPYMDNALIQLFYQAPESVRKDNDISCRLIRDGNPKLAAIMTDRGVSISGSTPLSKIVRFHREALFKVEYLYNEGTPDWMTRLDHVMRPLHPENIILGHHKIEHYRHWFCTELADYMRNIIMDDRTLSRPYWNRQFLTNMVDDHIKGRRNHIGAINKVLAIELIHRTLLENI